MRLVLARVCYYFRYETNANLIVSGAYERVIAEIAADVCRYHFTVNAISGNKVLIHARRRRSGRSTRVVARLPRHGAKTVANYTSTVVSSAITSMICRRRTSGWCWSWSGAGGGSERGRHGLGFRFGSAGRRGTGRKSGRVVSKATAAAKRGRF